MPYLALQSCARTTPVSVVSRIWLVIDSEGIHVLNPRSGKRISRTWVPRAPHLKSKLSGFLRSEESLSCMARGLSSDKLGPARGLYFSISSGTPFRGNAFSLLTWPFRAWGLSLGMSKLTRKKSPHELSPRLKSIFACTVAGVSLAKTPAFALHDDTALGSLEARSLFHRGSLQSAADRLLDPRPRSWIHPWRVLIRASKQFCTKIYQGERNHWNVTAKTFFERFIWFWYLFQFAPWVNCPCASTPPPFIQQLFLDFRANFLSARFNK